MLTFLQWGSVAVGLISALLWWLSAQTFFAQSTTGKLGSTGGAGDVAYMVEPGKFIVSHSSRVSRANGWAALLTGLAIMLQAIATAVAAQEASASQTQPVAALTMTHHAI